MKTIEAQYRQDNGSLGPIVLHVRFYNGYTMTLEKYNRINKARLLRRAVINKRLNLKG